MKFLSVIAASLAAFSAAQKQQQKPTSFRGANVQDKFNQLKDKWSQQKGGRLGGKKPKGPCSVANIPKEEQDKLTTQFKALDVSGNGSLEPKEFKDTATKILDAFQSHRKGQKPSWYKGGRGSGAKGDNTPKKGDKGKPDRSGKLSGDATQTGGKPIRDKPTKGGKPIRDRPTKGGKGKPDRSGTLSGKATQTGGNRRLQVKEPTSDFWDYLQKSGFVTGHQQSQDQKDRAAAKRAQKVFRRFDLDGNDHISLCEYETAVYREETIEKLTAQKGGADNIVVVSDH